MLLFDENLLFRVLWCVLTASAAQGSNVVRPFPAGFRFGAASSSYQVEGAWNEDGKAENIWDHLLHTQPNFTIDGSNGDVTSDAYHHAERDVQIMRELGLDFYRFSMSWPRLLPSSFPDRVNTAGAAYYNKLIDEMLKHNIQPVVTIYHWDLPQKLKEMGGWLNPYTIKWYSDYARVVFTMFGDRVKQWITINEPTSMCGFQYINTTINENLSGGFAEYMCSRNLLLAHAAVWHMYDKEFRPSQGGIIGMTENVDVIIPATKNDEKAAELANEFWWGWFLHPIFSAEGDYPSAMLKIVAEKSKAQGFPRSRMEPFTAEEVAFIRGTADFCGINHYSSMMISVNKSEAKQSKNNTFMNDMGAYSFASNKWKTTVAPWLKVVPRGFYLTLTLLRQKYNNPPIYVFENGFPSNGCMDDDDRIDYIRQYMSAMLDAMEEGSDVRVYTYWSMIDSFEWEAGFTTHFGLYHVDMTDPARPRTPRNSAFVYKHILRTRTLDFSYEPDTHSMTIDDGR